MEFEQLKVPLISADFGMENIATDIVMQYALAHLDETDKLSQQIDFTVYIVWKAKVLQNWKFLISTTLLDGMYYEVTYNGDKKEWYLDPYKKFDNKVIHDGEEF